MKLITVFFLLIFSLPALANKLFWNEQSNYIDLAAEYTPDKEEMTLLIKNDLGDVLLVQKEVNPLIQSFETFDSETGEFTGHSVEYLVDARLDLKEYPSIKALLDEGNHLSIYAKNENNEIVELIYQQEINSRVRTFSINSNVDVTKLIDNGNKNKIDLVILGDGYTSTEFDKLETDVRKAVESFFLISPYDSYQQYFNVWVVKKASVQSGVGKGAPINGSAFKSYFSASTARLLLMQDISKSIDDVKEQLPPGSNPYFMLIANTTEYGGAGYSKIATFTAHASSAYLALHEFGHYFGKLADEYAYGNCHVNSESSAANVTNDRNNLKWQRWIGVAPEVGIYEGADYCAIGKYRPTADSLMRNLSHHYFYAVNTEQLIKQIYSAVNVVDSYLPATNLIDYPLVNTLSFQTSIPSDVLTIQWRLNGEILSGETLNLLSLDNLSLLKGSNTISVLVKNTTSSVIYDPDNLLVEEKTWQVNVGEDTDGDGVIDSLDAFPNDATETVDTDGDGVGDNADAFPTDATEMTDTDGDGVGDNSDAFPLDPTETTDSDGNGIGDNTDANNNHVNDKLSLYLSFDNLPTPLPEKIMASSETANGASSGAVLFDARYHAGLAIESGSAYADTTVNSSFKLNVAADDSMSFALWFKPKDITSLGTLLGKGNTFPFQSGYSLFIYSGELYFRVTDEFGHQQSVIMPLCGADQWYYFEAEINRNSNQLAAQLDTTHAQNSTTCEGIQNATADISGFGGINTTSPLKVGVRDDNASNTTYTGIIDNISIYNRLLTEGERTVIKSQGVLQGSDVAIDSDGDGVIDSLDAFPNDATETVDSDGDGVGNNSDAFPNDATETVDTDGDGVGNNADAFPTDATETVDSDGDSVGDNSDAFPNDATETVDSDGDGVGDNADAFPSDATETTDTDGDGVGDNSDAFPNNSTETADTDGDGVGDNIDAFPEDATESLDSDNDGFGDNSDAFPNDSSKHDMAEIQLAIADYDLMSTDFLSYTTSGEEAVTFYMPTQDGAVTQDNIDAADDAVVESVLVLDHYSLVQATLTDLEGLSHNVTLRLSRQSFGQTSLITDARDTSQAKLQLHYFAEDNVDKSTELQDKVLTGQITLFAQGLDDVNFIKQLTLSIALDTHIYQLDEWSRNYASDTPDNSSVYFYTPLQDSVIASTADSADDRAWGATGNYTVIDAKLQSTTGDFSTVKLRGYKHFSSGAPLNEGQQRGYGSFKLAYFAEDNLWLPQEDLNGKIYVVGRGWHNTDFNVTAAVNIALDLAPEAIDTDGDGVIDSEDAFPNDATETVDTDGDGVGDNADAFPSDATETTDTDGDGVGNNADAFPSDATETVDTDGDGVGDNADAFPSDATETVDTDGDGVGDNADAFPLDPTETTDSDGNGIGDNSDANNHHVNDQLSLYLSFDNLPTPLPEKIMASSETANDASSGAILFDARYHAGLAIESGSAYADTTVDSSFKLNVAADDSMSFGLWFKPKNITSLGVLLGKGNTFAFQSGYSLFIYSGELYFRVTDESGNQQSVVMPLCGADQWYYFEAEVNRKSNQLVGRLDTTHAQNSTTCEGIQNATADISGFGGINTTSPLKVGVRDDNASNTTYTGIIDNISIYNRLLTGAERTVIKSQGVLQGSDVTIDSDGDGVIDSLDAFPNDATETADTDGDGVGDNSDAFPHNSTESIDTDNDGFGDNSDAFPLDPSESLDSDLDGVGNNSDAFPNDATETIDTDGDGVGDNSDAFPEYITDVLESDGLIEFPLLHVTPTPASRENVSITSILPLDEKPSLVDLNNIQISNSVIKNNTPYLINELYVESIEGIRRIYFDYSLPAYSKGIIDSKWNNFKILNMTTLSNSTFEYESVNYPEGHPKAVHANQDERQIAEHAQIYDRFMINAPLTLTDITTQLESICSVNKGCYEYPESPLNYAPDTYYSKSVSGMKVNFWIDKDVWGLGTKPPLEVIKANTDRTTTIWMHPSLMAEVHAENRVTRIDGWQGLIHEYYHNHGFGHDSGWPSSNGVDDYAGTKVVDEYLDEIENRLVLPNLVFSKETQDGRRYVFDLKSIDSIENLSVRLLSTEPLKVRMYQNTTSQLIVEFIDNPTTDVYVSFYSEESKQMSSTAITNFVVSIDTQEELNSFNDDIDSLLNDNLRVNVTVRNASWISEFNLPSDPSYKNKIFHFKTTADWSSDIFHDGISETYLNQNVTYIFDGTEWIISTE